MAGQQHTLRACRDGGWPLIDRLPNQVLWPDHQQHGTPVDALLSQIAGQVIQNHLMKLLVPLGHVHGNLNHQIWVRATA